MTDQEFLDKLRQLKSLVNTIDLDMAKNREIIHERQELNYKLEQEYRDAEKELRYLMEKI